MVLPPRAAIVTLLTSLGLAACGGGDDADPPPVTGPTWFADVAPILAEHCMGCHKDGGIAPFVLTDYDAAAPIAPQLLAAIEDGVMPPFDARARPDCTPRHGWQAVPVGKRYWVDLPPAH